MDGRCRRSAGLASNLYIPLGGLRSSVGQSKRRHPPDFHFRELTFNALETWNNDLAGRNINLLVNLNDLRILFIQ
jgi:hypothetical protein